MSLPEKITETIVIDRDSQLKLKNYRSRYCLNSEKAAWQIYLHCG